jgi:hypothetical protein
MTDHTHPSQFDPGTPPPDSEPELTDAAREALVGSASQGVVDDPETTEDATSSGEMVSSFGASFDPVVSEKGEHPSVGEIRDALAEGLGE